MNNGNRNRKPSGLRMYKRRYSTCVPGIAPITFMQWTYRDKVTGRSIVVFDRLNDEAVRRMGVKLIACRIG